MESSFEKNDCTGEIDSWIYEFSATPEQEQALNRAAAAKHMTLDELVAACIEEKLKEGEGDKTKEKNYAAKRKEDSEAKIHLECYYPVFKKTYEA